MKKLWEDMNITCESDYDEMVNDHEKLIKLVKGLVKSF
jgi:hypothetical protein